MPQAGEVRAEALTDGQLLRRGRLPPRRYSPVSDPGASSSSVGAGEDDLPTPAPALGPHVDDPVGIMVDVEVVLDHDTVLLPSTSRSSIASRWPCRSCGDLVVGSSRTMLPFLGASLAILMRWRPPPDSVLSGWPRVR